MSAAHCVAADNTPSALADIYSPDVTIAIWQRHLGPSIKSYANYLLSKFPHWQTRFIHQPKHIAQQLESELPLLHSRQMFIADVVQAAEMFSCLFELDHVGLRLAVLNTAMCPKFHVDRVPCRLLCAYAGAGTEWHSSEQVVRTQDGGVHPKPEATPRKLGCGDVALLKGEAWAGNEGRGLVHRSPSATDNDRRLVLTLDFA